MSNELKQLFEQYANKKKNGLLSFFRSDKNLHLKNEIKELTSFLDDDSDLSPRVYCLLHNIEKKPTCSCGKQVIFRKLDKGFFATCGNEQCKSKRLSEHVKESNKHKDWKKIIEKTKQTNLERYGNENYNNPEKNKKTCMEKYGVEHPLQNPDILEKQMKTTLERHGTRDMYHINKKKNK